MAEKPIIDIAVNNAAFEKFLDEYVGFSEKLDEQPKQWAAINEAMGGATDAMSRGFGDSTQALALAKTHAEDLSSQLTGAAKAQTSFTSAIGLSEKQFGSLAKSSARAVSGMTKAFSGAVSGSVEEMGAGFAGVAEGAVAALGPVGIAVGAIAAAVGAAAMGMKALADVAVSRQRAAYSLGVTPGLQTSFDINAQQFLGSGALAAASNAQLSYSSAGSLATLGIDFNAARKMSASDLAFQMLKNATKAAQAQPDVPLENIPAIQQYLRLGGQVGDVRNALKLGLPALNNAQAQTNKNVGRFELTDKAVADSAALKKSFESAGSYVQSKAINKLSAADPIVASALGAITGDKDAQGSVAHAFQSVTNVVTRNVEPALKNVAAAAQHSVQPAFHALQKSAQAAADALPAIIHAFTNTGVADAATKEAKKRGMYVTDDATYAKATAAIIKTAKKKGVDPVLALADALQESNLNPNLHYMDHYKDGSDAGYSAGLYSLNQNGEGAGMKLKAMLDPTTNATVALSEFAAVMRSTPAQIAARERTQGLDKYWSHDASKLTPGQIAALAERPADMQGYSHLVDALYQALIKANAAAQRRRPKGHQPHITVRNSTSARVAISANAVAMG